VTPSFAYRNELLSSLDEGACREPWSLDCSVARIQFPLPRRKHQIVKASDNQAPPMGVWIAVLASLQATDYSKSGWGQAFDIASMAIESMVSREMP
jgi:hypothetical protein